MWILQLCPSFSRSFQLFRFPYILLWRRQWHPTPVLLPGKSHERRSLVGLWSMGSLGVGHDWVIHFHFSLSCIGEGNGNPLQCSCLENPREGEPGGLSSMGLHRIRHDWTDLAAAAAADVIKYYNLFSETWNKVVLNYFDLEYVSA